MKSLARTCCRLALALIASTAAPTLWAQIVIGQSSGFTGPVSAGVKENTEGAKLYIDHVNKQGGIAGQRIELVSLDDKFDPKLTVVNARKLITEHKATALFLIRGTPHMQAILPLIAEFKVPVVAPSTGAMLLHTPVHPWIFNVRATYQRETEKAVTHLATIGLTRVALAHVDDTFGEDSATGARKGFERAKLEPLFVEKFDRVKMDFSTIAKKAAQMEAQALIFIGSAGAVSSGTKVIREAGSQAQIVTISNNASGGFIKLLGMHAHGVIVTQIFPYERSLSAPIVKEAFDLARAKGMAEVTPAMLEGYAGAKVLVEGLRRAGPTPTRAGLRQALETFRKVDIGGLEVTYTASNHSGLDYADLSIIGRDGKFRR